MLNYIEGLLTRLDAWLWRVHNGNRAAEREQANSPSPAVERAVAQFKDNTITGPAGGDRIVIGSTKCGDYDVFKFPCS